MMQSPMNNQPSHRPYRQWKAHIAGWLLGLFCSCLTFSAQAEDSWRDKMEGLIYAPRYFGPNAFPTPEMFGGNLPARWAVEVRGDFHHMTGDDTKDIYASLYVPIAKGKASVKIQGVIREFYKTSEAVRDERSAVEVKSPIPCYGDVIVNCHYQVLRSERWADITVSANLKTASGGRVCDARFTDAVTYWFDANIGRNLWRNPEASVRVQGLVGFYCWMTNDMIHRQNDAFCYGLGLTGQWRNFTLSGLYQGIQGYEKEGDRPMAVRFRLEYELKKNALAFQFKQGMKDDLYRALSLSYIRYF
ncbi:MAG: hypothetical protein ACI3ZW_09965 [Parabacteroides sp.]|nr:hypothetical protein [Parabacteroides sp.]MCI7008012.1 hypothetical protein [Parabacteroides sp.]